MINMPTKLMWHKDSSVSQVTEDNIRKRHLTNQKQLCFCDVIKVYFQILVLIYVSIFYQIYTFFNEDRGDIIDSDCDIQSMHIQKLQIYFQLLTSIKVLNDHDSIHNYDTFHSI